MCFFFFSLPASLSHAPFLPSFILCFSCLFLFFSPPELPFNEYYEYYGPDFNLHIQPDPTMANKNTKKDLETTKQAVDAILRDMQGAPSVQFHSRPRDVDMEEPEGDPDVRMSERDKDLAVRNPTEHYNGDKDQDASTSSTK